MNNRYTMPRRLVNSKNVYEFMGLIWATYRNKNNVTIYFDFSATKSIDPNIMAPLGMILTKIKSNKNKIYFTNLATSIKKELIDNKFILSNSITKNDIPQNYIYYNTFSGDDNNGFREYILEQLNSIKDSEIVSLLISRIMELFVNVKMHARLKVNKNRFGNKEIFSSGVFYKDKNYLIFSIANNGLTISENIKNNIEIGYDNESRYIEWALKKAHSTRETESEGPGGLGLFLLIDLIEKCKGKVMIASGKGFYRFDGDSEKKSDNKEIAWPFPGTVITIKIPIEHIEIEKEFDYSIEFDIQDLLREVM